MANEWRYALVHGDEIIDLTQDEVVVGRSRVCDVRITEASVSRKHFRLFLGDGEMIVQDLGSSNGSFVNDEQVHDRAAIGNDDVLRAGDVTLRVRIERSWEDGNDEAAEPDPKVDTVLLEHDFLDSLSSPPASGEASPEAPPEDARPGEAPSTPIATARRSPPSSEPVSGGARLDSRDETDWPEPDALAAETPGEHQMAAARAAAETPPAGTIWEISGEGRSSGEDGEPAPPPMAGRLPVTPPKAEPAESRSDEESTESRPAVAHTESPPPQELDVESPETDELTFDAETAFQDPEVGSGPAFDLETGFDPTDAAREVEAGLDALEAGEDLAEAASEDAAPASSEPETGPVSTPESPVSDAAASADAVPAAMDGFTEGSAAPAPEPPPAVGALAPSAPDTAADARVADRTLASRAPAARPPAAGFGSRLLAAVLEATWIAMLWVGVVFFLDLGRDARALQLSAGVVLLLAAVIILLGWTLWGTSPGKRILGLYVCTVDGRPAIGPLRAAVRMGGYLASLLPLGFGFLMAASKNRRALHDRLAGTYVARWHRR